MDSPQVGTSFMESPRLNLTSMKAAGRVPYHFIHDPREERPEFCSEVESCHLCIACSFALRPPVKQLPCGHLICTACLRGKCKEHTKMHGKLGSPLRCPGANTSSESDSDEETACSKINLKNCDHVTPYPATDLELSKLLVYCKYKEYGCLVEIEWILLGEHQEQCSHKPRIPQASQERARLPSGGSDSGSEELRWESHFLDKQEKKAEKILQQQRLKEELVCRKRDLQSLGIERQDEDKARQLLSRIAELEGKIEDINESS